MAFELDRDSHFLAGITPGDIRAAATDAPCWFAPANMSNGRLCRIGEFDPLGPGREIQFAQHSAILAPGGRLIDPSPSRVSLSGPAYTEGQLRSTTLANAGHSRSLQQSQGPNPLEH